MQARDIMKTDVITVRADTAVADIVQLLLDRHVSGVPVVDGDNNVIGIVSEGDLLRRHEIGTERRPSRWLRLLRGDPNTPTHFLKTHAHTASELMRTPVVSVAPDDALSDVVTTMESNGVKRVPVLDDGKLVGIIARSDLLLALARVGVSDVVVPPTDQAIRRKVLDALGKEHWSRAALVNVDVTEGRVSMWGIIDDEEHRKAICRLIEDVPGVVAIEDYARAHMYYS